MSAINALVQQAIRHSGLSRRALARRAQLAPETVSRICRRGTGDFATVAKLVRAAGLQLAAIAGASRDHPGAPSAGASDHERLDARSLALHAVIAGKLLANPALVASRVLPTVARFKEVHAGSGALGLLETWERAAQAGAGELARLCIDPTETGKQLRQASPMSGILLPGERRQIRDAFAA